MICKQRSIGILAAIAFLVSFLSVKSVYPITIGSYFPIATTGEREFSVNISFDGNNYLVGIQGDASSFYNVGGQLVSRSGTLIGSVISTGRTGGVPLVAFDGTNYLLVWEDDANFPNVEIYGQFISKAGTLVGASFPINQDSSNEEICGIAFDGTNYLIVWESILSNNTETIDGQLVSQAGNLIGSKFLISGNSIDQASAAVAFNGTNYLVVWSDASRLGTGLAEDIYGQFITPSGGLSGSKFLINQNNYPSDNPIAIVFDGTNYLVAWSDEVGGSGSEEWDLFGQLVDTSGTLVGGVISLSTSTGGQIFPFILFDGINYFVTWTDTRNDSNKNFVCDIDEWTCIDIYGQFVSSSGSLIGSEFPIVTAAGNQFVSPLSFDGVKYLMAWTNGDTIDGIYGDVYGVFIGNVSPIKDELAADFGASGLWHYDGATWTKKTSWNPDNDIAGWSGGLAADFGTNGLWNYDGMIWTKKTSWNAGPGGLAGWSGGLAADFDGNGLWNYDGAWTKNTSWNPDNDMAGWSGGLAVDFGANGLWNYDGSTWTKKTGLNAGSGGMAGWSGGLAADFDGNGLWNYDGSTWSKKTSWNPGAGGMAGWTGGLAVDFDANGLWNYDGATWTKKTSLNPEGISALGDGFAADFGASGIWYYDGATWTKKTSWDSENLANVDLN